jgi:hypothetical protein
LGGATAPKAVCCEFKSRRGHVKKLWEWATGWYNTLAIKYRNPELYEFLKNLDSHDPADYVEAPRP